MTDSPIPRSMILMLLPMGYGIRTAGGFLENHLIQG
jgi:hypothetical protein